jgi:hypothetical protein
MQDANQRYERRISFLFAIMAVLLPIQFWFAHTNPRGEPYPALVLPAFTGTPSDERGLASGESVGITVRFRDGSAEPVPLRTLLGKAPSSHIMAMAHVALKPKPPLPAERAPSSRLRDLLKRYVVPGLALSAVRRYYWSGVDPDTVAWLRTRVGQLFPGRTPALVMVAWYRDTYVWDGATWVRRKKPTVSLEVPL